MSVAILVLLAVLLISALCGWWFAGRKAQEKPVKIMMFVGYFWLSTFLQLMLLALLYYLRRRFFLH